MFGPSFTQAGFKSFAGRMGKELASNNQTAMAVIGVGTKEFTGKLFKTTAGKMAGAVAAGGALYAGASALRSFRDSSTTGKVGMLGAAAVIGAGVANSRGGISRALMAMGEGKPIMAAMKRDGGLLGRGARGQARKDAAGIANWRKRGGGANPSRTIRDMEESNLAGFGGSMPTVGKARTVAEDMSRSVANSRKKSSVLGSNAISRRMDETDDLLNAQSSRMAGRQAVSNSSINPSVAADDLENSIRSRTAGISARRDVDNSIMSRISSPGRKSTHTSTYRNGPQEVRLTGGSGKSLGINRNDSLLGSLRNGEGIAGTTTSNPASRFRNSSPASHPSNTSLRGRRYMSAPGGYLENIIETSRSGITTRAGGSKLRSFDNHYAEKIPI
jgi:hypothetical protein